MVVKRLFLAVLATVLLAGCSGIGVTAPDKRLEIAEEIAATAKMSQYIIPAGLFDLTAWGHMDDPTRPINVYIEGDGLAWISKYRKSSDPTPPDPVALKLAALDSSPNVIYIARPCQYSGWNNDGPCPDFYWTNGRTAPEVIEAFQIALDKIRESYNPVHFNLVGYSGGAAVAALVAAGRTDIGSIRTVAGNIDYDQFTMYHQVSPMINSKNPVTVAHLLARIPQVHFVGSEDDVVPIHIFQSWKQASGDNTCVKHVMVHGVDHKEGWTENWPNLLAREPLCY